MLQTCWFVSTACRGLLQLVDLGFVACPGSFPSCEESDPDPKSGLDLDLDKTVCAMSCREGITYPAFLCTIFWFLSPIPRLLQLTLEL